MKTYGGVEYSSTILNLGIDGGELSASRSSFFTPREIAPGTHRIGGWVGPRAGLDAMEKRKIFHLPGTEPCPFSRQPIAILTEPAS
jgi:hypothetical protein